MGIGDGTFQEGIEYPTGGRSSGCAVGDLDSDGDQDIVVADTDIHCVSVLLGNGDGTFRPFATYPTDEEPVFVALGDFNNDFALDLVTANSSVLSESISVLLGNGDGTFGGRHDYNMGEQVRSVAVGDIDADHDLDLAVSIEVSSVGLLILRGNGDGTFGEPEYYGGPVWPVRLVTGDVDRDGDLDLALADYDLATSGTWVILNQSEPPRTEVSISPDPEPVRGLRDPNPSPAPVHLSFRLDRAGGAALTVYDARGRLVTDLWNGRLPAGEHRFTWDGRRKDGSRAPAGVYFCRWRAGGETATRKVVQTP